NSSEVIWNSPCTVPKSGITIWKFFTAPSKRSAALVPANPSAAIYAPPLARILLPWVSPAQSRAPLAFLADQIARCFALPISAEDSQALQDQSQARQQSPSTAALHIHAVG